MPSDIKYIVEGKGEVVLLLHGWGQNKEMMLPLIDCLKHKYKCVVLDLPGFGKTNFNDAKNIGEYVGKIRSFLEEKKLLPKYLVGHSFGGKLCIEYYLKYRDVSKIALIASPILKPTRSIRYYFKVYSYKLMKRFKSVEDKNAGSVDYKECKKVMKNFFVSVVNTHYDKTIKQIDVPTLLLWGDKDDKVPLNKAKKLNKLIQNSSLHIVKGGHFAYLENVEFSKLLLNKFFRG